MKCKNLILFFGLLTAFSASAEFKPIPEEDLETYTRALVAAKINDLKCGPRKLFGSLKYNRYLFGLKAGAIDESGSQPVLSLEYKKLSIYRVVFNVTTNSDFTKILKLSVVDMRSVDINQGTVVNPVLVKDWNAKVVATCLPAEEYDQLNKKH